MTPAPRRPRPLTALPVRLAEQAKVPGGIPATVRRRGPTLRGGVRRLLRDAAVDTGYAVGWSSVHVLPESLVRRQFDALAEVLYRQNGRGMRRLRGNLRRVLGPDVDERQAEQVTRDAAHSYLRYWCEVFRLPAMTPEDLDDRFHLDGAENLSAAVRAGRGFILALPHMANWDHAGAWLVHQGVPFTTVAERLRPERLFDRFVEFRESIGMEVIPLTGGSGQPIRVLAERLRAGGCLCLLADRDVSAQGIPVSFFGAEARMPSGPARLALSTGAPVLPTSLWYDGPRRLGCRIEPPLPLPARGDRAARVAAFTQRLADSFARAIAQHPADWHMLQRIWVDDPPAKTRPGGPAPLRAAGSDAG
jgi:lauroyl/myristoyl acyltransferase